jgi:hypothetical protein
VETELDRVLQAAQQHPTVRPHVERAVALARFEAHEDDGPFWRAELSTGVPQYPAGPLFPALHVDDDLSAALEAAMQALVWAADCAEYADANLNAAQYLRAAGHLDLAHRAALALAGPGLGLVLAPPRTMRELAAGLGLRLEDVLAPGEVAMGSLPPRWGGGVSASFRWDIHHEHPITEPARLGSRELEGYSVHFDHGKAACEAATHTPGFALVGDDAFTLTWTEPGPEATPPPTLLAAIRAGEPVDHHVDAPAREVAEALGVPDAIARTYDVHMSSWYLATADGGRISAGGAIVEARLEHAHGERVPGLSLPAAAARVLHADDRVAHLRVTT